MENIMATVIKKQPTKDYMFAWHIDDHFEKNSTFDTKDGFTYVIVQDGKVIGSTTGKTQYGNKTVKLSKKFFPELKCGLFSKNVNVDIYCLKTNYDMGFSYGNKLNIFGDYPKNAPANKTRCLSFYYTIGMKISDVEKAYKSFFVKTESLFITIDSIKNFIKTVSDAVLDDVVETLSFPLETPIPSFSIESHLTPESKELFTKFKALAEKTWKDFGYDAKISLLQKPF